MIFCIKMKILVFGNPLIEKDSLALRILPKLRDTFPNIEFKEIEPSESLEKEGKNLTILDVGENIDKVEIIDDIDKLQIGRIYTLHDFDLTYNLKLLKKIGKIKKVKIICIPQDMDENKAFSQIQFILRKWVAQDMQGS